MKTYQFSQKFGSPKTIMFSPRAISPKNNTSYLYLSPTKLSLSNKNVA